VLSAQHTVNFIPGMDIKRDHANMKLWLDQRKHVEMILQRFNLQESKLVKVPIPIGVNYLQISVPRNMKRKRTCPMFHMLVQLEFRCMQWYILDRTLHMQWEF
jgi:ABC-type methionine transport system ATPase subunit